jgi:hypothetical protein
LFRLLLISTRVTFEESLKRSDTLLLEAVVKESLYFEKYVLFDIS